MPLAFDARQKLDLPVKNNSERLPDYLLQQERVVGAMLDSKKLISLGDGNYRYTVTSFKVFQLEVNPIVSIAVLNTENTLQMSATDSTLDGLGLVDDFELMLDATLTASSNGLEGIAHLGVTVSQPPLLKFVPSKILESTGQSILNGILLGIKARVGQQLVQDFALWCTEN
ncbi:MULTISPECIES: DUF1997 domain-containing protein [Prochlorococcus]|uniref:DUF1997 domain-containing protein n=1 Tax=Prochlorococcus TaxID=1218 RepID=UPI000533A155|nr:MULTISPECIES: DUF1997 domain-containing protein [Prochlorococcus]KGG13531.1 Nucleoside-diphosphate-sugar pyrophosphorylase involved in lipopolysaccharide biosynthesis/translation initiation factor 2B [Prochlorococcus sp. MIT 0601]